MNEEQRALARAQREKEREQINLDFAKEKMDLAAKHERELARLRLLVNQRPDGVTVHEIWISEQPIGADPGDARKIHEFNGMTRTLQVLEYTFPKGTRARYLQVRTVRSPSWVAWGEVDLLLGDTQSPTGQVRGGTSEFSALTGTFTEHWFLTSIGEAGELRGIIELNTTTFLAQ